MRGTPGAFRPFSGSNAGQGPAGPGLEGGLHGGEPTRGVANPGGAQGGVGW